MLKSYNGRDGIATGRAGRWVGRGDVGEAERGGEGALGVVDLKYVVHWEIDKRGKEK